MKNHKSSNNIETLALDPSRVVDVITCAAPNNNYNPKLTDDEIYDIHKKRIERILLTAIENGVIILGAHGCGEYLRTILTMLQKLIKKCLINIDIALKNSYCNT